MTAEKQPNRLEIKDFHSDVIRRAVSFIYSGWLCWERRPDDEHVHLVQVARFGEKFGVGELVAACFQTIYLDINLLNVTEILTVVESVDFANKELRENLIAYVAMWVLTTWLYCHPASPSWTMLKFMDYLGASLRSTLLQNRRNESSGTSNILRVLCASILNRQIGLGIGKISKGPKGYCKKGRLEGTRRNPSAELGWMPVGGKESMWFSYSSVTQSHKIIISTLFKLVFDLQNGQTVIQLPVYIFCTDLHGPARVLWWLCCAQMDTPFWTKVKLRPAQHLVTQMTVQVVQCPPNFVYCMDKWRWRCSIWTYFHCVLCQVKIPQNSKRELVNFQCTTYDWGEWATSMESRCRPQKLTLSDRNQSVRERGSRLIMAEVNSNNSELFSIVIVL